MSKITPLLNRHDKRTIGIAKAAWKLEDALNDRLVDSYPSDLNARDLHFQCAQANKEYSNALLAMILLTIIETPSWCDNTSSFFSYMDPATRCTIPGVSQEEILLSNLPYIAPGWGIVVEVVLVFIIARKLLLERKLQIRYFDKLSIEYNNLSVISFGLFCCVLELLDCGIFVIVRPRFRFAFLARTGYLLLLPAVRRLAHCISAVIGEFLSIAAFYAGTIVFFAWIAVVMFDDMEGLVNGEPVNKGFDSFRTTLNTMFIAGSTDEFVECFLPTYTAHRASGLLWLVFLIIVQVLLLNLVLDTLVAAYTRYAEATEESNSKEAVEGIKEAFKTVSEASNEGDGMTRDTFLEFVRELSKSPAMRMIPESSAEIVFRAVDKDGSGAIDVMEFFNICGVIQYEFWTTKEDSLVKEHLPALWNSAPFGALKGYVRIGSFDTFMNWVLMVNLVLVICESVYDLNDWPETTAMENLELSFSLVYVTEVGIKLCVWDFWFYWSLRSNQFDFITTWMLLASSVLDELVSANGATNAKRYMNILRLLRLLRVLKQLKGVKKVQMMVETIINIVCASKNIMTLLGVVTFFFSMLSVQLWGGMLYRSNPRLEETEYSEKGLFVLNFNDFGTAFGVWVVSLLCEYVPVFPDVISKTSNIPGSWLVFLLFYIVGVSIVFELVKAFTIEAFLELHKKWGHPEEEFATLKAIEKCFLASGLYLHSRVVGDMGVHEKIMKALEEMEEQCAEEGHGHHKHGNGHGHGGEHGGGEHGGGHGGGEHGGGHGGGH